MHNHCDLLHLLKYTWKKKDRNLTGRTLFLHNCHKRLLSKPFTDISFFKNPRVALGLELTPIPWAHCGAPASCYSLALLKGAHKTLQTEPGIVHSREPRDNKETKTNQQTFRVSKYQKRLFRDSPSVAVSKTWGTVSTTEENHS